MPLKKHALVVIQSHWKWRNSTDHIRVSIGLPSSIVITALSCIVCEIKRARYRSKFSIFHPLVHRGNDCEYFRAVFSTAEPDGYATIRCNNIAEKFTPLSRVHQRYRQQTTDGKAMPTAEGNVVMEWHTTFGQTVPFTR